MTDATTLAYIDRQARRDEFEAEMTARFPGRNLTFSGHGYGAVPVQIEGTIDGKAFYFRFRYNNAQLYVGQTAEDYEPASLYTDRYDVYPDRGEYAGDLSLDDLRELLPSMIESLAPITPEARTHRDLVVLNVQIYMMLHHHAQAFGSGCYVSRAGNNDLARRIDLPRI